MIIKNDIPILEYDGESKEVFEANHESKDLVLPEKCVFAFLGDIVDDFALKHNARILETFETVAQNFNVYSLNIDGQDICLVRSPIGAPAATSLFDMLVNCGCKVVVAVGSCGTLSDLPENAFVIPTKALRDEGTSYHYLPPSRFIDLDKNVISAIEYTLNSKSLPYEKTTTWTTDGLFRETKDLVNYRLSEGCKVVEMECSALAACARKRGSLFGQILFTADSLANVDAHDPRNFGRDSHELALTLCVETVLNIKRFN